MGQAKVPGDSGMLSLSGQTGVFDALSESHEQIIEGHDASEAEAELSELANRNGAHDKEFAEKLARVKNTCSVRRNDCFRRLVRNLRKIAEADGDIQKAAG